MRRVMAMATMLAAACGGVAPPPPTRTTSPDMSPSRQQLAVAAFRSAFEAQAYDQLPSLRSNLQAARDADPGDVEVTLSLAHANLWTLGEIARDPHPDVAQIAGRATDALTYFTAARKLAPDDHRIEGWLGTMQIAIGNFTMNPALATQGGQTIDDGVAAYPEFNLFVREFVDGALPTTQAPFAEAVAAMWRTLDLCAGEAVDRVDPDLAKYLARMTTTGPQRVCWNDDKAQHNLEGFSLYAGDLIARAGDGATAARLYANARLSPTYDAWPFHDENEARIRDATARAGLYADADPANDPPMVGQSPTACASCHATR